MRIWVTRTEPGATATADRLKALGHEPLVSPVLAYRVLPGARVNLARATALALTSRNAVRIFSQLTEHRSLPVFVTGEGTAAAARQAGFATINAADGDVADLAALIAKVSPEAQVVWPAPLEAAGDLIALLAGHGVRAERQAIYATEATGAAPPEGAEAVLVHSAKGARAVAEVLDPGRARSLQLFAISAQAAAPLAKLPFARVAVAPRPNETALLSLLAG